MKKIFCLFLVLFLSGCAATHVAIKKDSSFTKYKKIYLLGFKDDPRKILPKMQKRLEELDLQIILTKEDEPLGGYQGTGFVISPDGYILTSAHIFNKEKVATVWLNNKRYEADIIYIEKIARDDDKEEDGAGKKDIGKAMQASLDSKANKSIFDLADTKALALLKIRSSNEVFNSIIISDTEEYQMGQEVYTIGYPLSFILGDNPRLNKGFISSTVGIKDNPDFVQISVAIQPGNSGGPLLDNNGKVIGVIQTTLNPMRVLSATGDALPQNVNFAIKSKVIKEFLDKYTDKAQLSLKKGEQMSFNDVQNSVVKIHSGSVSEDFIKEPKLVCSVAYQSFWDMWFRFSFLDIVFYDFDTQEMLLRAGQYGDNAFSTEDGTLDRAFKDIKEKIGSNREHF